MSDLIKFRQDSDELSKIKDDAKIVRDCFDADVASYLRQFPTESQAKFDYRKDPYISKFTNFVSSAINAATGIAMKKPPMVDDDDLVFIPQLIGQVMMNVSCDGVGFLLIDAPKLVSSSQKENTPTIDYIKIDRIIGDPVKDMNGNIIEFVFQGEEEVEIDEVLKIRKYRKKLFIDDKGNSGGEKYIEVTKDSYKLDTDHGTATWVYGFQGLPVLEIDILTAGKHPYIDIAKNNLWLYNLESDERNIIHFICSPYVQFFGEIKEDNLGGEGPAQVFIGADRARRFNDKSTEGIEITEAKGTGVQHATKKIESASDMITRMSASVLSNSNYQTATQAQNAEGKSIGFLPFTVMTIEDAFNKAIEFMSHFRGLDYEGGVTMAKRFTSAEFNNAQLTFVRDLFERGIITKTTMLDIAKEAELVRPSVDNETEIREAEEQMANVL